MTDENISVELKRLSRRIEELQKTMDLLHADREIFEDILSRMTAIESAIHLQRSTATETAKDIKSNINDVKDAVDAKVDEVNEFIDDQTVVVKSQRKNVIDKIIDMTRGVK